MTTEEEKPKVEGKKPRRPTRAYKKDYTSAMAGLEDDTFDIGHPKYAAKYEVLSTPSRDMCNKSTRWEQTLAMRELIAPTVTMPTYPADHNNQELIHKSGRKNSADTKPTH